MHSVIKILNFAHNEDILFQSANHASVSQRNAKNYILTIDMLKTPRMYLFFFEKSVGLSERPR